MIARLWHGITLSEVAEEYLDLLQKTGVTDYLATPGNRGVQLLHRIEGRLAHYLIISHWDSLQAIEAFAGSDITRSKYYPEDADFLLEYEPTVQHYEIEAYPTAAL